MINKEKYTEYQKQYRLKNLEKLKENCRIYGKKYYLENRDKLIAYSKHHAKKKQMTKEDKLLRSKERAKQRYLRNKPNRLSCDRKSRLKRKYGITPEDYDNMLKSQNNLCAICFKEETAKHKSGKIKILSVDHNHETGENRGLLCSRCNFVLGSSGENIQTLKSAITYLEKFNN